jgi:hypothetical protein
MHPFRVPWQSHRKSTNYRESIHLRLITSRSSETAKGPNFLEEIH